MGENVHASDGFPTDACTLHRPVWIKGNEIALFVVQHTKAPPQKVHEYSHSKQNRSTGCDWLLSVSCTAA